MPNSPSLVAGADVVKGRWICVVLENGTYHQAVLIGLPADGTDRPRPADLAARTFIGPRRSSVFTAPPRPDYDEPISSVPPIQLRSGSRPPRRVPRFEAVGKERYDEKSVTLGNDRGAEELRVGLNQESIDLAVLERDRRA